MILLVYLIWRAIGFLLWFGVMFALCTIAIAVAAVAVLSAVAYGLLSPTRTPKSVLRALAANSSAGIAQVRALRPR